ncbi:alpha-glucosidase [Portibacter marinus]|uniref:alpha-glucosidase n=1 Tax=Portibacter marinus TaxID=2898660 RepID=UPI001F40F51B|nr:alpha-glucosidase [Portibacter marinus]
MQKKWWKEAVMYQVYPRSFKDSNGDGIGDLPGILEKVDHLVELGIDIVWLGPIYDSPNDDNGYDIRDYYKIHSEFGTMEDFDLLLKTLHFRGIKLIMDLVVNHTSDEHEWFMEARKSKDNPYRDYYHWTDEPNNYISYFGGSAWEQTEETGSYYLHLFTKKQPDLNWSNPKVRKEVYEIMKFWLDKGVDGFRMDVISLIAKPEVFKNSPSTDLKFLIENHYANGPGIHEYLQEMYREVLQFYDVMTVGEGPGITKAHALNYVSSDRNELNMIFQLDLMFMDFGPMGKFDYRPFTFQDFKRCWMEWDMAMKDNGWNNIFLDNHDFPRMVSRFGNDSLFRIESAKLLAMLLLTFRGTPCIYQGSEMGMTNVAFSSLDDYDDVEIHNFKREHIPGDRISEAEFLKIVHRQARDNARTPVQWDDSENAGFTEGEPWIKVNPNYKEVNLDTSREIFDFYKRLISFRKSYTDLVYADLEVYDVEHPQIFFYRRGIYFTILNMSDKVILKYRHGIDSGIVLMSTHNRKGFPQNNIDLNPWEGILIKN